MNIFIMILLAILTVGYYVANSPGQRVPEQETQYAVNMSDLRSVAECTVAVHNAKLKGTEFDDICVNQNGIVSEFICLDSNGKKTKCEIVRHRKPAFSYIVTATKNLPPENYNNMMTILEQNYPDTGTFGIFADGKIVSGSLGNRRTVPPTVISELKLTDGQLVYMTQYEIPDEEVEFVPPITEDIICPAGTIKTYKFGRWQCTEYNIKTTCGGDTVWDSKLQKCVSDESRKPLCTGEQTAVLVDNVWECINPFPEKKCPNNYVAVLNYSTMEWECVPNPDKTKKITKCDNVNVKASYGAVGTTLRVVPTSCTDCEKMITDPETCISVCVPDTSKLNDPKCYPGNPAECSGSNRGFYFGFPDYKYISEMKEQRLKNIRLDSTHSKNRMFNCLDCGDGEIDRTKSQPPLTAVCK